MKKVWVLGSSFLQASGPTFTSGPTRCGRYEGQSKLIRSRQTRYIHIHVIYSITLSPVSLAALGMVSSSRGLSLRFPRFIKTREDKSLEQASTVEFLAQMWEGQQEQSKAAQGGTDDGDLVDVEPDTDLEDAEASEY